MEPLETLTEYHVREGAAVRNAMLPSCRDLLPEMARCIADSFSKRRRLFLFGNGGSAADAQHIAAEFVNRLKRERAPLPALALTVDTSILTSIGNDYGFEDIFVRQLSAFGEPGDVALGISTSGRSENVLKALAWGKENGLTLLSFTGRDRTQVDALCDHVLHVPCEITQIVQECHIMAGHILCALVEQILFGPTEDLS